MTVVTLRPYQREAVAAVMDRLRDGRSTLLVMATGLGKTVVFGEVVRRALAAGRPWRTLVVAHRAELIHQAAGTIRRMAGCEVDIEMGGLRAHDSLLSRAPVVVTTVQTQVAGRGGAKRMHRFDPEQFGLLIVDEAHHAVASSYRDMIAHYAANPALRVLGVTATPDRKDEAALGEVFESVAYDMGIREGIASGWLVPVRQRVVHVESLDFSACRTTAGDLNGADLDRVMQYERTLHGMVHPTIELCGDRRCIVFTASVAHSDRVAEILNRHRPGCAVAVDGGTDLNERRARFRQFADGERQYLVNCAIATEGWDDAATDGRGVQVVAMMRPTKSRALYSQMVGRGTRPLPGTVDGMDDAGPEDRAARIAASAKPSLCVLDFVGNAGRHKLVHASDALAGRAAGAVSDRAARAVEKAAQDGEVDVMQALDEAEREAKREAERRLRKGLVARAGYSTSEIDPFSLVALSPDRSAAWRTGSPATEKQVAFLRRLRVALPEMLTAREARSLIDAAIATPTPKQQAVLLRAGLDPDDYDRRSASEAIDGILGNRRKISL